jgi:hypothetical protein
MARADISSELVCEAAAAMIEYCDQNIRDEEKRREASVQSWAKALMNRWWMPKISKESAVRKAKRHFSYYALDIYDMRNLYAENRAKARGFAALASKATGSVCLTAADARFLHIDTFDTEEQAE